MTYNLEVERDNNASNGGCDYKMRVGTTYILEVERDRSQLRLQNKNKNDVPTGGGEGGRRIRSQL
jgi:hypothetical protein